MQTLIRTTRIGRYHAISAVIFAAFAFAASVSISAAQSIIAGDVTGTVTDPSGAIVANAAVTLTNVNTNTASKSTTNADGTYRFAFAQPGSYTLSVSAAGFQTEERAGVIVTAGQPTPVNVQLSLASSATTVNVVETSSALQTENGDVATRFDRTQVENLPNPGGDLTYLAQTAPGVVMNTQSGYGNFSAAGMPGTSNLFTVNGENFNDPFLSLNDSGASNLLLGINDIGEANVITNPYSAQYGQYAGAQVTYITKSGTNQFHGDAVYMWNGRALNANQFFSNQVGQPAPFNNFNQWATGVQGPIWKNRTFFDVDYEGLRNVLPTGSTLSLIPSSQFQAGTLANLASDGNAAEIPFYKQMFTVYNGPSASATPVAGGGCQGMVFPGLAAGAPCALQFRTTPPNLNREYQWSGRVDHTFNDKDRGYIRVWRDSGFQPTFTSPFGPVFNDQSNQPQMSLQLSESHTFGPNTVNQFNGSALFYAAVFVPSDPAGALSALPTFMTFSDQSLANIGSYGEGAFFPQGRRVFQYQIIDDFSHVHGNHTLRAGFSWLHDTLTDLDFEESVNGTIVTNLADFFAGGGAGTTLLQNFPSSSEENIALNTVGGYVADDWRVNDRLTVSLNLRLEHYADPTCAANCFTSLANTFTGASDPAALSTPYNQLFDAGRHSAYPNTQAVVWEPRIGLAWKPSKESGTVIRIGAGVFADELPGYLTEYAAFNVPNLNQFSVSNGAIAPGVPGSLFTTAAISNQALNAQFKNGGSFNTINASLPQGFSPPDFTSFPSDFKQPTYYKWNFEIQRELPGTMVLSVNYSGNHGTHIPVADEGLNAFCPPSACPGGFLGLPAAPPNAALGTVLQYLSAGTSSYNGLIVSLQKRLSSGLSFNINYTWSHALDDVSNGGVEPVSYGFPLTTDASLLVPENPFNIRDNRGNSDFDVRHYLSASSVVTDLVRHAGFKHGPNQIFGGWTLSTNWFFRTGLPFSVVDGSDLGTLEAYNYSSPIINPQYEGILATPIGPVNHTCLSAVNSPCLTAAEFAPAGALTAFGPGSRNQFFGPHFFDVDLALMKDIRITERVTFSFGAQAYNLLNHANFDQPVNDISNPLFGSSIATVAPPTSLLGSFVGTGSSPRFIEIKGSVRF